MDEMITDNPWALITDILMIYILKLPVKNKIHTIKKMKLFFIIRGSFSEFITKTLVNHSSTQINNY
jgi:hypothetical protein